MSTTSPAICHLCEAECGILVEHDGQRVLGIRGDRQDPLSRGHICPKAAALADLHHDPDRLRRPQKRVGPDSWRAISWDQAIDEVAERLVAIQREHGNHSVGLYLGNPTVHSHGASMYTQLLRQVLHTRHGYSSNSMDALPRLLTSYLMYGAQTLLPVPDIDRTHFWLILGANPVVSNGSVMTAPGCKRRIKDLQKRGGQVVVIDPRQSETATIADRHLFIRPSTDAFLLCAMLHTVFARDLAQPGRISTIATDIEPLRDLVRPFTPERVAPITGIPADQIIELTSAFAQAPSAVCYGRMGTCTQEFGTLTSWLIDCLNIVTGNFDRAGGAMFPTPAVDLPGLAKLLGLAGSYDRFRSRINSLPEFAGELPVAVLADEMATEGEQQIRALITHAGNPVLSAANGAKIEQALGELDFMVAIDIYRNETTRHADYILPPTTGLERDHYPLVFAALSVRNTARYSRAVFDRPAGMLHDWEILGRLATRIVARRSPLGRLAGAVMSPLLARGPEAVLRIGLRTGPHRLSMADLDRQPHGIDLGPLTPRLPKILCTKSGRIELTPEPMVGDLERLRARLRENAEVRASENDSASLQLISRRELRSNNSWLHNSYRLVKGKPRCVLHMHPDDARARGIGEGTHVQVRSRVGALTVPVALTSTMMPGVVSLPFGWGHDRPGIAQSVAAKHPGVSLNDITDEARIDPLSGCTSFEVPVSVERADIQA